MLLTNIVNMLTNIVNAWMRWREETSISGLGVETIAAFRRDHPVRPSSRPRAARGNGRRRAPRAGPGIRRPAHPSDTVRRARAVASAAGRLGRRLVNGADSVACEASAEGPRMRGARTRGRDVGNAAPPFGHASKCLYRQDNRAVRPADAGRGPPAYVRAAGHDVWADVSSTAPAVPQPRDRWAGKRMVTVVPTPISL